MHELYISPDTLMAIATMRVSKSFVPVCFICGKIFEISKIYGILCDAGKEIGSVCLECIEAGKEGFKTRIGLHIEKVIR